MAASTSCDPPLPTHCVKGRSVCRRGLEQLRMWRAWANDRILSGGIWRFKGNLQTHRNDSLVGGMRKKDGHAVVVIRFSHGGAEGGLGGPCGCVSGGCCTPLLLYNSVRTEIKEDWTVLKMYFLVACSFQSPTYLPLVTFMMISAHQVLLQRRWNRESRLGCLWVKLVLASAEGLLPASIGLLIFLLPWGEVGQSSSLLTKHIPLSWFGGKSNFLPMKSPKWLHWTIWMTWPNWFSWVLLASFFSP